MPHTGKKAHLIGMLCLIFLLSGCSTAEVEDNLGWLDNKVGDQLKKLEETDLSSSGTSTPGKTDKKKEESTSTEENKEDKGKKVKSAEDLTEAQKERIDEWLEKNGYNRYGDSKDAIYAGGTPLFDEKTGERMNRYDYILKKFPNILERIKEEGEQ